MQKKITFAATSAMAAILVGHTKIRMETRDSGVIRVKPTNRVVSKDLAPLIVEDDGSISAIIPQRYFEQALKVGNVTIDAGTAKTDTDEAPIMQVGLEKQAHGWLSICSNATGMELTATLQNYSEPVAAPAGQQQTETTQAPEGWSEVPAGIEEGNPAIQQA
jgi:hypothetical protein